jgi:hypothetical protein
MWRQEMKKNLNQQKKDAEIRELKKKNKELERELRRKDKALAEMSALVVLKKKWMHCGGTGNPDRGGGTPKDSGTG